ncbi:MAG TPA: polymer-forming cytoskeletal protein [Rhizobiales bacterium]|nr:polymer-forming cytoskeletal [bacterium BMS3Bbin10]HDO51201.1 polymer-forming cytoskeletal protein [Hyphomicrobiales bacterium]
MFKRRRHVTVIAEGLNIAGNVSAEGLVEVHGEIEGELNCTALHVSDKGRILGKIVSQDVVVNGTVDGPIHGVDVRLESKARVTGDVHHESFAIEKGAFFDGRSKQKSMHAKEKSGQASTKQNTVRPLQNGSGPKARAEATAA